jgi:hypothetical protein
MMVNHMQQILLKIFCNVSHYVMRFIRCEQDIAGGRYSKEPRAVNGNKDLRLSAESHETAFEVSGLDKNVKKSVKKRNEALREGHLKRKALRFFRKWSHIICFFRYCNQLI